MALHTNCAGMTRRDCLKLGLTVAAVMTRHTRALVRLRSLLDDGRPEEML